MSPGASLHRQLRDRLAASPLVVLLDVDGTLSPIAPTPSAAAVSRDTRDAVAQLAAAPGVHVALVSGRAAADARRLVGADGVWAIGNHGFERIAPDGTTESDASLAPWLPHMAAAAAAIAPHVDAVSGAMLEDKRWTLSIHVRQAAAGAAAQLAPALAAIASDHELVLTHGKMVFEIRPPVRVDKGTASVALVRQLTGYLDAGSDAAVLYAGDDRTDEDAFAALRRAWPAAITIRIAPEDEEAPVASAAEFALPDVDAMGAFLARLAAQRSGMAAG